MKSLFSILAVSLFLTGNAFAEDIRVMACTVDFKAKGGMASQRTQEMSWNLNGDKGSVSLKSMGKVKISLAKKLVGDKAQFRLAVRDEAGDTTELNVGHRAFEVTLPISLHIEDGEDGADYDQVKISCNSTYAAG